MKFSLFQPLPYFAPELPTGWPQAPRHFDPEYGLKSVQQNMDIIDAADEGGFDYISVAEHHYAARQMCPSPTLAAALISQRLKNASVAILGVDLPLHNPVRIAEELAMLDAFGKGRLLVGMFRGTPNEYITYGHNPAESKARFEEALHLVLAAWTEPEPFGWEGIHYRNRLVSIWPQPVQRPRPPVLVSGNSPSSAEFAAKHRLKIGLSFAPVEVIPRMVAVYREAAARHGWEPTADDILWRGFAYVAETDDKAQADCARYEFGDLNGILAPNERQLPTWAAMMGELAASGGFGGPPPSSVKLPAIMGSPDTVIGRLEAVRAAGVGIADLILSSDRLPAEKGIDGIRLFTKEVIPAFR